ncbi:hypothetical protein [Phytohabitans rumicis]|nr:hypothetical protein [Phytohabitans rumicis]
MSSHEGPRRIDRATAERLLRGGTDARDAGQPRLAAVLAAAAAPHGGGPVRGESAALAAFRATQLDPHSRPQRQSMIKTALAKLLTVKIAAVTAGALGVGGVALASTTGTLPGPLKFGGPSASHSPKPDKTHPTTHPTGRPSDKAGPPGLVWLCHDYIGKDRDHRGKALNENQFRELADKAGGRDRDKADKFCDDLLRRWPSATPKPRPTGTPSPRSTDRPDGDKPGTGDRPGGDESTKPTTAPTGRPSGSPSPR